MNKFISIFLLSFILFLVSCASDTSSDNTYGYIPYNVYNNTDNNADNNADNTSLLPANSSSNTNSENTPNYIRFRISVAGEIKGSLYYCVLINTEGNPIQVDDIGTYTDVIRICNPDSLDAPRYHWYHRLNDADRLLTVITDIDNYISYSSDKSTVFITFPLKTSSVFKNQVQSTFATQALITTSTKEIGKFIDTLGPDISSCTHYSFLVSPLTGAISSSLPSGYPGDSIGDYYESNIPSNTPDANADLTGFSVEVF